jgi:hypothetical protein
LKICVDTVVLIDILKAESGLPLTKKPMGAREIKGILPSGMKGTLVKY